MMQEKELTENVDIARKFLDDDYIAEEITLDVRKDMVNMLATANTIKADMESLYFMMKKNRHAGVLNDDHILKAYNKLAADIAELNKQTADLKDNFKAAVVSK